MREATLYTIKSQRVVCGSYFEMAKTCGPMPSLIRVNDDGIIPADMPTVEVQRLPVHAISRIEHGQRSKDYIVLEPELREILEAPFAGRVAELETMVSQIEELARYFQDGRKVYERRIERFNKINWFRRVWHVICGARV